MNNAQPTYEGLVKINEELRRENAQLKFDLEQLRKAVYGSKSERFTTELPCQGNLFGDQPMEIPDRG
ncbi:MAG: hypothetical protein IPL46_33770 [Saprospiraceae bacterium]|nr:hypothetical protein [Saprospiraceae bacterium]